VNKEGESIVFLPIEKENEGRGTSATLGVCAPSSGPGLLLPASLRFSDRNHELSS
jgi:hypothetical protein